MEMDKEDLEDDDSEADDLDEEKKKSTEERDPTYKSDMDDYDYVKNLYTLCRCDVSIQCL